MGWIFVKNYPDMTPEDYGFKITEFTPVTDNEIADLYQKSREMYGNIIPKLEKYLVGRTEAERITVEEATTHSNIDKNKCLQKN